jgi:quercetin dioxygenase-like cupin family protein
MKTLVGLVSLLLFPLCVTPLDSSAGVQRQIILQTTTSWDGTPYKAYPSGQPELSILRFTMAPHSVLTWHTHPIPNAAYVLSGDITVEKRGGPTKHFHAGEVISELVDQVHRGVTGDQPVVLLVFYAGTPGTPLARPVK